MFAWTATLATAFFRSIDDAITPLKVAMAVVCINVPLNYLLIHGAGPIPALGVEGAAWGTVLAEGIGTAAYFCSVEPARGKDCRPLFRSIGRWWDAS